jgi:hypothetical protein
MNQQSNNDDTQDDYAAFIAIDWADQKHTFSLKVAGQAKKKTVDGRAQRTKAGTPNR